jgi:putative tricarboxylic transport membrane protein
VTDAAGRRDLLVGALAVGGGALVIWLAGQIRGMPGQPFTPGFVPAIVGGCAALVGAAMMLRAVLGKAPPVEEEEAPPADEPALRLAALWVLAGIAAIAVLFEVVGFIPLLVVWITGFLLLLGVRPLPALAFAVPMVVGMDLAFSRLLGVPLPPGDWVIELGLLG